MPNKKKNKEDCILIFKYELIFVMKKGNKYKNMKTKKAFTYIDRPTSTYTNHFRRVSKKKYIDKKLLKDLDVSIKKVNVTKSKDGKIMYLNISFNTPCHGNDKIQKKLSKGFYKGTEDWYNSPEDYLITSKNGKKKYVLEIEDTTEPSMIITEDEVILSSRQSNRKSEIERKERKKDKYIKKIIDKHSNIYEGYDDTKPYILQMLHNKNKIIKPNTNPKTMLSSQAKKQLISEYHKDIGKFSIGNCTNAMDYLSGTPLSSYTAYEIFQIKDKDGRIDCYSVKHLFNHLKSIGRIENPRYPNVAMKMEDIERLQRLFIINGYFF